VAVTTVVEECQHQGNNKMSRKERSQAGNWILSRTGLALVGFLAIVGFFLVTEHRAHLFGFLPFLLLLLCPLLHWLMHGGHGGGEGNHSHSAEGDKT
jgi:hypothetical protein